MVWAAGLEPATSAFQAQHSTHLSYAQIHRLLLLWRSLTEHAALMSPRGLAVKRGFTSRRGGGRVWVLR